MFGCAGRQIEGVWHTGVVVYGEEFTFGGSGIMSNPPVRSASQLETSQQQF